MDTALDVITKFISDPILFLSKVKIDLDPLMVPAAIQLLLLNSGFWK